MLRSEIHQLGISHAVAMQNTGGSEHALLSKIGKENLEIIEFGIIEVLGNAVFTDSEEVFQVVLHYIDDLVVIEHFGEGFIVRSEPDGNAIEGDTVNDFGGGGGFFPQGDIFFAIDHLHVIACAPGIAGECGGHEEHACKQQAKQGFHGFIFLSFQYMLVFGRRKRSGCSKMPVRIFA